MTTENRHEPTQNEPISHNRICELIHSSRSGDEDAFNTLFRMYSPLVEKLVEKYCVGGVSEEELRSGATEAFTAAVTRYDTKQSAVTFGLYTQICIANRLNSVLRSFQKKHRTISLDEMDPDMILAGEESDPSHFIMEEERYADFCRKMEAVLSPAEGEVWMLLISGLTAPEIAERLGVSRKSVENTLYRARKKLRESFSGT